MRGRRSCASARALRPLFLFPLSAALSLAACTSGGGKSAAARCDAQGLLATGGPQASMRRTLQELALSESSEEATSFLCYCQALIHRDVASRGRAFQDRPALFQDFGAAELKGLRKAPRRSTLRLVESVAATGVEPCDTYAWEALLQLDEELFETLAAGPIPGAPAAKEKAGLARRRVKRPEK